MLGLCCQWLDENEKNILKCRGLKLGKYEKGEYSYDRINTTYINNLTDLCAHLDIINAHGIKVFRMSSSLLPLFDKVPRDYWDNEVIIGLFKAIGEKIIKYGMRLTTHPGQCVVMSSPKERVRKYAIMELNFHSWVFDKMGLGVTPYYSINVHGGGKSTPERFGYLMESIELLDDNARGRLTLENCEFGWTVDDLLATNIPVCFDSHHFSLNPGGLDGADAMAAAIETWPGGAKPLTHLSNAKEGLDDDAPPSKKRAHSDYIYDIPEYQLKANNDDLIDIDVEAKKKNLALFALRSLGAK